MDTDCCTPNFDIFAAPNSPPQSLRELSSAQTKAPNEMSRHVEADNDLHSQNMLDDSEDDYTTEDDVLLDPAPSGRSSISSFPASIIHHNITPSQTFPFDAFRTPPRSRARTPINKPVSPFLTREHLAGFRNPSSVRALQMQDEFSDNEDLTPGHRRRGSRMSYMNYRLGSAHSTPGKRTSRSLQGSPVKNSSRLLKEFPLVLLHCTLLPSVISPKVKVVNEELLEAIIPEPYKKRWKLLQEKVVKNFEVRERGVLVPHPKEDYDLLEDTLLETLELERPAISNGHFIGRSESRASTADSGFGSEDSISKGDTTDEECNESKCADCGNVCGETRWEVRIYAANGLMRAGAWAAAWSEMEKVDVQVSVVLPEDVRIEIEARLDAVIAQEQQLRDEELLRKPGVSNDERTKEIYGDIQQKPQEDIDGLGEQPQTERKSSQRRVISKKTRTETNLQPPPEVDLQKALLNYARLLLQDGRNLAILFLAVLAIFYSMNSKSSTGPINTIVQPERESVRPAQVEYLTTTIFSTSTSVALETSTVTETAQVTLAPVVTSAEVEAAIARATEDNLLGSVPANFSSVASDPLSEESSSDSFKEAEMQSSLGFESMFEMLREMEVSDAVSNVFATETTTAQTNEQREETEL